MQFGRGANRLGDVLILDSIVKHARHYEDIWLNSGEAATLNGLILYLEELARSDTDHRHPPLGHDAVTLMTYHGAKGLEWPVVVLCGLDSDRDPDVWLPVAHGGNQSETHPLDGRLLRYWIWPFGNDNSQFGKQIRGSGLEIDALASAEGIAARTKARSEESIRLLYVGCTRAKQKLSLADRPTKYDWLKQIADIDVILDPALEDGEHQLSNINTTFVRRRLQPAMSESQPIVKAASTWLADVSVGTKSTQIVFTPQFGRPHSALSSLRLEDLAGSSLFPSGASEEDYAAIGDATHTYLGSIPSMQGFTNSQKIAVAERSISGFGVTGKITPAMLVQAGDRFCKWVSEIARRKVAD